MMDRWKTAYLSGLTHMASSASRGIGPSYIDAVFFGPPDPLADFFRYYGVTGSREDLESAGEDLETVLGEWLRDKRVTDSLFHWIRIHVGKPGAVWFPRELGKLDDAISLGSGGRGPFFFLDGLCFAEFPNGMACFMIGNDE